MSKLSIKPKFINKEIITNLIFKKSDTAIEFNIFVDNEIIGMTMLKVLNHLEEISLEIVLFDPENPKIKNKGYGFESTKLTIDFAFLIGIDKLIAFVYNENIYYQAVINILKKLDFELPDNFEEFNEGGSISFYEKINPNLKVDNKLSKRFF